MLKLNPASIIRKDTEVFAFSLSDVSTKPSLSNKVNPACLCKKKMLEITNGGGPKSVFQTRTFSDVLK